MSTTASPTRPDPDLADLRGIGAVRLVRASLRVAPELREGVVVTGALALLAGTGRIVAPLAVQQAIDAGVTTAGVHRAVLVGAVALLVAGASSVLLNRRLQLRAEDALATLRRRGLARIHDMSAATVDRLRTADLVARLTSDVDQVTTFLQGGGVQLVTNCAQLVVAGALLVSYSWQLSLPVLALSLVLLTAMLGVQRVIARRFDVARRDLAEMQTVVAESIAGVPVIRSTGTDERIRERLDAAVDRARDSQLRTLAPLHANTSLGEIAISTMTVAVLVGGVWWSLAGGAEQPRLSVGEVVSMVILVTFFVRPLQFLVQGLGEAQNAITGWRRALEVAVTPSAVVRDGQPLPDGPVGIELRAVSARYGDGPLVLRDVSLRVEPGEHVAVVGHTGSGKSTLAKLLTGRLEPVTGQLLLSGVPRGVVDDASAAGRVVIVPQDPFLFEGSIADNVRLGSADATEEDVRRVLEALRVTDWSSALPEGLATPVGRRGERLSVGERQLVALARTALVDPDLVVLDEATSGIDPATDVAVQAALGVLTRGRTTVSIAHRMNTAAAADRVLVLDAGRLVQDGHHDDLLTQDGPYAGLVAAWQHAGPVLSSCPPTGEPA